MLKMEQVNTLVSLQIVYIFHLLLKISVERNNSVLNQFFKVLFRQEKKKKMEQVKTQRKIILCLDFPE